MDFFDKYTTVKTDKADNQSPPPQKIIVIKKEPNQRINSNGNQPVIKLSANLPQGRFVQPIKIIKQEKLSPNNLNNSTIRNNGSSNISLKRSSPYPNNVTLPIKIIKREPILKSSPPSDTQSPTTVSSPVSNNTVKQIAIFNNPGINSICSAEYKFENIEFGEFSYSGAYSNHQSTNVRFGKPHPSEVVESKSLANEENPIIKYQLRLPSIIFDKCILSNVQLEAVICACQKHEEFLTPDTRAGFFIGDGAGVGKGRTVAGIIMENIFRGRERSIWISVSNDLRQDAKRDLDAFGDVLDLDISLRLKEKLNFIKIKSPNGSLKGKVLFITYSFLISTYKKAGKKSEKSRFNQIIKWFGRKHDGVIVLDECHKAKNLYGTYKTKTGTMVKKLQDQLLQARIVYSSATGASEPKHMAYMVRLGLWGPGKPFNKFDEFETTLNKHGVGAMELVAMEMKRKGMYIARQLSYENVQFKIHEVQIAKCQIKGHKFEDVYNRFVQFWVHLHQEFKQALIRNKDKVDKDDNSFEVLFWSAHQRFFKYLCISAKIDECVRIAMEQIERGKCIVIGLQSTGESSIVNAMEKNYGDVFDFVSNSEYVLKNLIENHYPSARNLKRHQEDKKLKLNPRKIENKQVNNFSKIKETKQRKNHKKVDSDSEDSESDSDLFSDSDVEDGEDLKDFEENEYFGNEDLRTEDKLSEDFIITQKLLDEIEEMKTMFPINPLDHLIDEFGGPDYVAELTGRRGRMAYVDGKITYQSRIEGDISMDQINILEKERFNSGEKLVAIISDATSTGISLHSDLKFRNIKQRFHITLELPWSADKAIQQFGRTHRSNQAIAPHYLFLISDLPGERRFAASVAKRLESLGALTHGDRRCADTRDLSQFNIDNEFGAKAAKGLLNSFLQNFKFDIPFPEEHLQKFGCNMEEFKKIVKKALNNVGIEPNKSITVTKFLNRILGLELDMQNALFQYFIDLQNHESDLAKSLNKFDYGIRDIINDQDNIFKEEPEIIHLNEKDVNSVVKIHKVTNMYLGVPWAVAMELYIKDSEKNMFCESINNPFKILALAEYQDDDTYKLITPNFPTKTISSKSFHQSYKRLDDEKLKNYWNLLYLKSENNCHHKICQLSCLSDLCTFGKRKKTSYIITGDIFLAWKKISFRFPMIRMEVVRIRFHDGSKIIGALISSRWYNNFRETLMKSL